MTAVVVNCRFLTQPITGVQRFAEEIVRRLGRERDDVELVAPPGELRSYELAGRAVNQIGTHHGHLWEQLDLAAYVRKRNGTLLSLSNTGPIAIRRQVLVIHDLTWRHCPQSYSLPFRLGYRALTRCLVRRVCRIATVSEYSRTDVAHCFGLAAEHIDVIPNAVDESFAASAGRQPAAFVDEDFFLVVSSLNLHKNVGPLVSAYRDYLRDHDHAPKLVLVGGGATSFAPAALDLDSDDERILALGRVDDEELIWLYRHARAFIFPSRYEGFGIPPLEAQACDCPVLSSNAASLPEVLADSALYFDPRDAASMVSTFDKVQDPAIATALVQAGRANVARFSWDESARRLSRVLDEVG